MDFSVGERVYVRLFTKIAEGTVTEISSKYVHVLFPEGPVSWAFRPESVARTKEELQPDDTQPTPQNFSGVSVKDIFTSLGVPEENTTEDLPQQEGPSPQQNTRYKKKGPNDGPAFRSARWARWLQAGATRSCRSTSWSSRICGT